MMQLDQNNVADTGEWIDDIETSSATDHRIVAPDEFGVGESIRGLVDAVAELMDEPERDDDGSRLRPTDEAYENVSSLISRTAHRWMYDFPKRPFPKGWVSDNGGGIRIEWSYGDSIVVLNVEPSGIAYTFVQNSMNANGVLHRRVLPNRLSTQLSNLGI